MPIPSRPIPSRPIPFRPIPSRPIRLRAIAAVAAFSLFGAGCVASVGSGGEEATSPAAPHADSFRLERPTGAADLPGPGGEAVAPPAPPTTLPSTWQGAGEPATFHGCQVLDRASVFRSSVIGLPVHPRSDAYLSHAGGNGSIAMRITDSIWQGSRPGIPINVVDSASIPWTLIDYDHHYPDDHYPNPLPLPAKPKVEGDPSPAWDHHVVVFDTRTCGSWELISYNPMWKLVTGKPWAAAGAHYNSGGEIERGRATTVAGSPIMGTMIRLDEVRSGRIDHVIGAGSGTTSSTNRYVWPAKNGDGTDPHPDALPVGTRLRMKSSTPTSQLSGQAAVIATALKEHGLMIVDSSSPGGGIGFGAENVESGWDEGNLSTLGPLLGLDNFEVVDQSPMMVSPDSWSVR